MGRIEKDHWFVKGNELSISLMRFHVKIKQDSKSESYILKIGNSMMEELKIKFSTLEESIYFTENYITISNNLNDILEKKKEYEELLNRGNTIIKTKTRKV